MSGELDSERQVLPASSELGMLAAITIAALVEK